MTKFLNISKDSTLGNTTPSDILVSSQKAIKTYVDNALIPTYKIAGRVNFSELPQSLTDEMIGNVYSVNDPFTSDSRFVINGANYTQGTNVVVIETTEDIIYYGYYSSDSGETIYTLVAPTSLASNDKVYSQVQGEMVEVGYVSYCESYDDYCTIYSWIDNDSNEHYDYNEYNESYNISIPGTTPVLRYDSLGGANTSASINTTDNYVPYRSDSTTFSDSSLMYNSSAMAFTGKLHIGSSSPSSHASKGRLTIYDNTPSQQVSSIALLNYGGGGGCGVSIDMYNTSANGGIPSGRFGVIDNGNYSGYLQLQVKKSGSPNNTLLPAMNIVPLPVTNSLTTCVSFGQDEFNRVLFDLHKPESYVYFSDSDKKWSGSGTTYTQSGPTTFNGRLIVAVGDIVSFDNFSTEARVVDIVSSSSTLQITTDVSLGSISNQNIYVKKAYFKITDENYNTKVLIDPYGKMCIGKTKPDYELDVAGNINASTDIKINGVSVALPNQSGNDGKFLTTNGSTASWATISTDANVQYISGGGTETVDLSQLYIDSQGATYGFSYDSMSGTVRNANQYVDGSFAYGYIELYLENDGDITISFNQDSEQECDFGEISELDEYLNQDNQEDTDYVAWSGKESGSDSITFSNVTSGSHFFTIKYIKDGSEYYGSDTFEITGIEISSGSSTGSLVDTNTQQEIPLSEINDMPQVLQDIRDSIPDTSNFVTLNTKQMITAPKAITGTDVPWGTDQVQKNLFMAVSNSNTTSVVEWIGRSMFGANNLTFLMGTINGMAALGAHSWTNAQQGTGAAWADIYINPDGDKAVKIGGSPMVGRPSIMVIQNMGQTTTGTVKINRRPQLTQSALYKDVACWDDNVSKFNNDAGYITGIDSNDVINALGYTPQEELVSGTNIKTINNESILGEGNLDIDALPAQSGQNGKFLTTNGTTASWADIPEELPAQSGQSGKVLTTNGTSVSWTNFPTVDQTYSGTSTNAQSGVAVKQAIDADYAMVIVDYTS